MRAYEDYVMARHGNYLSPGCFVSGKLVLDMSVDSTWQNQKIALNEICLITCTPS